MSAMMLICNILCIIYIVKVKAKIDQDYKVQYEMMGKKEDDTCLSKFLLYGAILSYFCINALMLVMVIFRIVSASLSDE